MKNELKLNWWVWEVCKCWSLL